MMHSHILISGGLATGGVQTHVSILCKELRHAGASVTVAAVATNWSQEEVTTLKNLGVRVLKTPWGFERYSAMGKIQAVTTWPLLLTKQFDVLYCIGHGRFHLWMKRFLKNGGISIYHEIVGGSEPGSIVAKVAGSLDAIVANSTPVAEELAKVVDTRPIRVIPFLTSDRSIPPPAFRPLLEKRLLRFAYLGRLVKHKQPDWLVTEWSKLSEQEPLKPAHLDVYGTDYPEGALLNSLRAWIQSNGLSDRITLHGAYKHESLSKIFAQTDLIVLPSRLEGLPLVLVEAMQYGVPFVAMAAGGISELARDNPDVDVVPIDNEAFKLAMLSFAGKLRRGEVNAQRLHKWVETRYGYDTVASQWRDALLNPGDFWKKANHGKSIQNIFAI